MISPENTTSFKPDPTILKALRGQPLHILLAYAATGSLPTQFNPAREEKKLHQKVPHKNRQTVADQITALRQDADRIKKALEWYPVAIILPIIRYYCQNCARTHTAPQGSELLQYEHPKLGHKAVSAPLAYDTSTLPRRLCISDRSGFGCHECFPGQIIPPQTYLCKHCLSTLTGPNGACPICQETII